MKVPHKLKTIRRFTAFKLLFSKAVNIRVPKKTNETEFFGYMNRKYFLQRVGFKKWTVKSRKERKSIFQKLSLNRVAGTLLFLSVALMVLLAAYSAYFVTTMEGTEQFQFWGKFGAILVGILIAMVQEFIFSVKRPFTQARSWIKTLFHDSQDVGSMQIGMYYYLCLANKTGINFTLGTTIETEIFLEYNKLNNKLVTTAKNGKNNGISLNRLGFKRWRLSYNNSTAQRYWGNSEIRSFTRKLMGISFLMTFLVCLESLFLCLHQSIYFCVPAAGVLIILIIEACVAYAKHK